MLLLEMVRLNLRRDTRWVAAYQSVEKSYEEVLYPIVGWASTDDDGESNDPEFLKELFRLDDLRKINLAILEIYNTLEERYYGIKRARADEKR